MSSVLQGKLIIASTDQSILFYIGTKLAKMWKISWTNKNVAKSH